jgi:hypothetical protein
MKLRRYASATEFLRFSEPWLLQAEPENNLVLGIAHLLEGDGSENDPPKYWASVEQTGSVAGCVFRTPPHPLGVTTMPMESIPLLVEDVGRAYEALPGVNGPRAVAEAFARQWADLHDVSWRVRFHLRIHVLTQVRFPAHALPGRLRKPAATETSLIREWTRGFVDDTGIVQDPDRLANELLQSGRLYLWDDEGPRCMVGAVRETPNGTCISAVYTPRAHRRHGYASLAVATLSQQRLSGGNAFCCLYTDGANPTSNAIYRRLGYEPIRDDVEIAFSTDV